MYETLLTTNKFLMQSDDERRLAHRREIKLALASISVKKSRIAELKDIVQKLSDDSDKAADEHGTAAGLLQSELDALDAEQIESVLAGTPSPPEAIQRRRAILDELNELNRVLEVACEGNRRAARPIEKQIHETLMATTAEGALRNQLTSLCSVSLRRKQMLCGHKLQLANAGLREATRIAGAIAHNGKICTLNHDSTGVAIASVRQADAEALVSAMQAEITALHAEAARLQAEALAE